MHELVVKHGLVVDGQGGAPFASDVAIDDGRISEIGLGLDGTSHLDATGCIVTPGFVDIHTHYDGQAVWSDHLTPSSLHGVTTAVVGNCGVGFAPCRPEDHDLLVNTMEGVEDIPDAVMTAGLPWTWTTFEEFLATIAARRHDIDLAAFFPHSPLRVYVMGERGANREPATDADLREMAALVRDAMAAGAVGVSTSRIEVHRRGDGAFIPSYNAEQRELETLAGAMDGRGILQIVTNVTVADTMQARREEITLLERVARASGVPITFSLSQQNRSPEAFDAVMEWVDEANSHPGVSLHPQFAPRPIGMHVGHALSAHPFSACPTYRAIAHLPLAERVGLLRRPDIRRKIVGESADGRVAPIVRTARQLDRAFVISDPPDYEPDLDTSVAALAERRGVSAAELAYDLLLEQDGTAMLYVAISNYGNGDLDHVADLLDHPKSVIGLGDGGAHYGMICDASYPTWTLTHWVRDRAGRRISLASAIRGLAADTAQVAGLSDRGVIAAGYKADINIIDLDRLRLEPIEVRTDLPAGGRRLFQSARGYRCTIVSGRPVVIDDQLTGELPGHLAHRSRPAA